MKRLWRAWVELLGRRERGTSFALFRIAVALVILGSLLSVARADLVEVLWLDAAHGGYRDLPTQAWLPSLLGGASPTTIWTLYTAALIGTVLMGVGFGGRLPIAVVGLAYHPLATINADAYGGYDLMIGNAVWMLFLGDANATLSLDCRRRHGRWTSDAPVAAWPRYVLVFQLLVIYTSTGLHKLSSDWIPGGTYDALYWVFQDPTWTRFDLRVLAAHLYPLTRVATAVTWIFEVTAAGMLLVFYFRATAGRGRLRRLFNRWDLRKPWATIGITLHLGILLTLNVGPFSWISLAYYLCLWRPEQLESVLCRIRRTMTAREVGRNGVQAKTVISPSSERTNVGDHDQRRSCPIDASCRALDAARHRATPREPAGSASA